MYSPIPQQFNFTVTDYKCVMVTDETAQSSDSFCQALQIEKKEAEEKGGKEERKKEKGDDVAVEKEGEKEKKKEEDEDREPGLEGSPKEEKEEKTTEEEAKASRASRRCKTMQIKVTLLDDTLFECELDVRTILFYVVIHHAHIK